MKESIIDIIGTRTAGVILAAVIVFGSMALFRPVCGLIVEMFKFI